MQNVFCLFSFKPVKDQVLPFSGSLFPFNLDVPDTCWRNIPLQRLFVNTENGVLQEGKTVENQSKSSHSSGSSLMSQVCFAPWANCAFLVVFEQRLHRCFITISVKLVSFFH